MDLAAHLITPTSAYVVYHGIDVDGLLSAALIQSSLVPSGVAPHNGILDYQLFPIDIPDIPNTIRDLESTIPPYLPWSGCFGPSSVKNHGRIIFADLAFNKDLDKLEETVERLAENHQLELYDPEHLMQAERLQPHFTHLATPDHFKGQATQATGRMIANSFRSTRLQHIAFLYGALCQAADFPEGTPEEAKKYLDSLQDLISSGFHPKWIVRQFTERLNPETAADLGLAGLLPEDPFSTPAPSKELIHHLLSSLSEETLMHHLWHPAFDAPVQSYRHKKIEASGVVQGSLDIFTIHHGIFGAIAYSPDILYMKPGIRQVIELGKRPFNVCVFESGKVIFSKNEQGADLENPLYKAIHCGDIGKLFGGGGRETGGGGNLGGPVWSRDYPQAKHDLLERLAQEYFYPLVKKLGLDKDPR